MFVDVCGRYNAEGRAVTSQLDGYQRDGFVIVRGLLSAAEVQTLRDEAATVARDNHDAIAGVGAETAPIRAPSKYCEP